jgi:hypothetical protein
MFRTEWFAMISTVRSEECWVATTAGSTGVRAPTMRQPMEKYSSGKKLIAWQER